MASAAQPVAMPLFYKDLVPLNRGDHGNYRTRTTKKANWLVDTHAIPLTVEEFPIAQRHFPIVFSAGNEPVPLALMGMNEGVNVFVDQDGTVNSPIYMPAYVRRYPFMLAKLKPDAQELSLCFDPTSDLVGEYDDGQPLFTDGEPSETCQNTLKFCENFELAGKKTANFLQEIQKQELLIDGELKMQMEGREEPFVYRGFKIIDEKKMRDLRGDVLRGWSQSGLLPLIYAHLFSLDLVREIFAKQVKIGKGPMHDAKTEETAV
ncbi:peptidase [Novosphingobium marinum]|uniref:Multidrug transporter n=1 Tax=Novosphingobium marinum TaxID=1514948 RepID=A0A7Y9XVA1_9SPHN|nr:SapC family protein [Novosphingobium marinum]NYH93808.1 hypothetical protein [Novosphingobium marinum]GGC17426.1 peptidase [Novosphingobium marinum]